jgi:hypothetical protein
MIVFFELFSLDISLVNYLNTTLPILIILTVLSKAIDDKIFQGLQLILA